jgi:hypothetical protein
VSGFAQNVPGVRFQRTEVAGIGHCGSTPSVRSEARERPESADFVEEVCDEYAWALEAVVADRNSPQKHVWRARIVLPSRIPPLSTAVRERAVDLTLSDPPGEATHWTAAMMAKAAGISVSSVQRIWRAHGL